MTTDSERLTRGMEQQSSPLRHIVEFLACLALLVTLCRGFLAEGYMIETGSMAPSLLGFHKRAVCPACGYSFAVEASGDSSQAECPNCGQDGIPLDRLLRNEGDQLLVERCGFDLHRPQRWDVIVFRNPSKPTQAYVKRLVALPGEDLQIRRGDIYISGVIRGKNLESQRGMRIPVYNHDYQPAADDPQWQPRWLPDPGTTRWQARGSTFFFDGLSDLKKAEAQAEAQWIRYRHWVRQAPGQVTSVELASWPKEVSLPAAPLDYLQYDTAKKLLLCKGTLPPEVRDQLLAGSENPDFQRAIREMFEASHIAPIGDFYGYNTDQPGAGLHEVRDLALEMEVHVEEGQGQFLLGISDGLSDLNCLFDMAAKQVQLTDAATGAVLLSGELPQRMLEDRVRVELSLMDRQALVAVNGRLVFEPWHAPLVDHAGSTPWRPVRFGARQLNVEVRHLRLYRDVYYTPGTGRRAADAPYHLQAGEFFALGDNSPVSRDSRSWAAGDVLKSNMFIGRPFLVHLPSQRKQVRIGSWRAEIRIPDFSRIRYIR